MSKKLIPNLLVVGGTGFIGRNVVEYANKLGWNVTSISLTKIVKEDQLDNVEYLFVDITNRNELDEAIEQRCFEYVINCGGYVDHRLLFNGGISVFESHFYGLYNVISSIDRKKLIRFINIGSSDEYGDNPSPQDESYREAPISPYSLAKVTSAHLLQMLYRYESFPAVTLRLFLVYGPNQATNRFIPQIINGCLNGDKFSVSEGLQLRDFCYIDDVINAVFKSLTTPAADGHVINIGSGQPVSIRHIVEYIKSHIKSGEPIFGEIPYRDCENMELYAKIKHAKRMLGWSPVTTLEVGLNKTIESFKLQLM